MLFFIKISIFLACYTGLSVAAPISDKPFDLQVFGDTYFSIGSVKKTRTKGASGQSYGTLRGVRPVLEMSRFNLINFEGVINHPASMALEFKKYLLMMSSHTEALLAANGLIHGASLGNNHAMDFGTMGLFATISALDKLKIRTVGAGESLQEALRPMYVDTAFGSICVLNFSRTLPTSHYAQKAKPGTANVSFTQTKRSIQQARNGCKAVVVIYHWGAEGYKEPKEYQIKLAHLSVDAGADLVVGHHPHVNGPIEVYRGKRIFYSIGNFAFGTLTYGTPQSGMSIGVNLGTNGRFERIIAIPLKVDNRDVKFAPRPFIKQEEVNLHPSFQKHCREKKGPPVTYECH